MGAGRGLQVGALALIGRWLAAGALGSYVVAGVVVAWDERTYPTWEWGPGAITLLVGTVFAVHAVPAAFVCALVHLLVRPVQRVPARPAPVEGDGDPPP